jgi:hypothetical protein
LCFLSINLLVITKQKILARNDRKTCVNFNYIINGDLCNKTTLQSKKGYVITGIILAAITAGSFAVWMVPQNTQTRFVVSNAEEDLDAMIEQQKTILDSTIAEFSKMLGGEITPDAYIGVAEISSSQISSFIIKTIDSDIPQEWQPSYSSYMDSLRADNSYIKETIVVANMLKEDPLTNITQEMEKLDELSSQADEFLAESDSKRPS